MTAIPFADARALTAALVATDSRNPSLAPGAAGEAAVARVLADVLTDWGFTTELVESSPGRPSVLATGGRDGRGTLILNGHIDTVGVEGMVHPPFDPVVRHGRMYGRGSCDMKAGVASMCAATARALKEGDAPRVIIAAVTDEEFASAGTRTLLARGLRGDAAIVTEPTSLAIMPAHRGFAWITVRVQGRAAHGSRYDIGVDAIKGAAAILSALDHLEATVLTTRTHPLLGHASLHASTIEGGIGWSTYPDQCVLKLERRTLPGEQPADTLAEVEAACARVVTATPGLTATATLELAQSPSDVPPDAPVVRALATAVEARGQAVRIEGMTAWTDAALFNDAGIPAICFGPGDIMLAHAAEEYVPVHEIDMATDILESLVRRWGRA